ncbi:hypothetical protein ES708_09868 [subsurface metagenome]
MAHGRPDFQAISTPTLPDFGEGQVPWFQSETKEVPANSDLDLINYVVPDDMELRVCSGIVSCKAPRTQKFKFTTTPAGSWISPTGHSDPDEKWDFEERVYDGDIETGSHSATGPGRWSSFLELFVNPAMIDKVRFYADWFAGQIDEVDVDVYYEGNWHHVYEGVYAHREWVEKALVGARLVSTAQIRFKNADARYPQGAFLWEFQFNTAEETAQETIYFDTYAIIPYLPEAPYPVPSGATFKLRVYNDDDAAQYMSVNLAGFLQSKV